MKTVKIILIAFFSFIILYAIYLIFSGNTTEIPSTIRLGLKIVFWLIITLSCIGLIIGLIMVIKGISENNEKQNKNDSSKKNDGLEKKESSDWQKKYPILRKVGAILVFFFLAIFMFWFLHWFTTDKTEINKGLYHGTKEIIIGVKTREEIVADSIQKIADAAKDAEKARSRAEDQKIAEEGGVFGSVAAGLFGKRIFRGKSGSQESEETEDLTNSVPSNNTDRQNSNTSVAVPDPNIAIEQERMKNLLKNQNTDPQGNPIVPVTYPGSP
jgi:hypothetical protein